MTKSKVFLTGGAGFIGSLLAVKLVREGYEVVLYDALRTFVARSNRADYHRFLTFRMERLFQAARDHSNGRNPVTMIEGDIRDVAQLNRSMLEHRPDVVVHLAAIPIADASKQRTEEMYSINLTGTTNTLNAARDAGVGRFVYTSSSMTYGDFHEFPAPETHPTHPLEMYGATKLCGEVMTRTFTEMFGLPHVIVRPCSVYGPADTNWRIVQRFVESAVHGRPIHLFEGGRQVLDFTWVGDVVEGFFLAATHPAAVGETFNMTSGVGRSLRDLAEITRARFPDLQVEYREAVDPVRRTKRDAMDISKARRMLGYEPRMTLEEGFSTYADFYLEPALAAR